MRIEPYEKPSSALLTPTAIRANNWCNAKPAHCSSSPLRKGARQDGPALLVVPSEPVREHPPDARNHPKAQATILLVPPRWRPTSPYRGAAVAQPLERPVQQRRQLDAPVFDTLDPKRRLHARARMGPSDQVELDRHRLRVSDVPSRRVVLGSRIIEMFSGRSLAETLAPRSASLIRSGAGPHRLKRGLDR